MLPWNLKIVELPICFRHMHHAAYALDICVMQSRNLFIDAITSAPSHVAPSVDRFHVFYSSNQHHNKCNHRRHHATDSVQNGRTDIHPINRNTHFSHTCSNSLSTLASFSPILWHQKPHPTRLLPCLPCLPCRPCQACRRLHPWRLGSS